VSEPLLNTMATARARHALVQAGLDSTVPLEAASSVTNEVWLTQHHVIRVNRRPNQRLRREAILGPSLPAEIGYPGVVVYGGQMGADFLVVKRVDGLPLAHCWPEMSQEKRRRAISQLAAMLKRLHETPGPSNLPAIDTPQMLRSDTLSPVMSLLVLLDQARSLPHVDRRLMDDVEQMVYALTPTIEPFDSDFLIHGDLTFENVLWDGTRLTALLDFEWARTAPPDVDLDVFLRMCCLPQFHVGDKWFDRTKPEDYRDVPWWLAEDYPELFTVPRQHDRLRLYAIAYDLRDLTMFPPTAPAHQLNEHHSLNRLRATVLGNSHLDLLEAGTGPV
jgi:aminoglycoside phosphotransferase (APT) family kinase protein